VSWPLFSTKSTGFLKALAPGTVLVSLPAAERARTEHSRREQHFVPLKYIYYSFISDLYSMQCKDYIAIYEVFVKGKQASCSASNFNHKGHEGRHKEHKETKSVKEHKAVKS
jgi:hypothetical protein